MIRTGLGDRTGPLGLLLKVIKLTWQSPEAGARPVARLLDDALRVHAEAGPEGFTMTAVIRKSGVSSRSLYHHSGERVMPVAGGGRQAVPSRASSVVQVRRA